MSVNILYGRSINYGQSFTNISSKVGNAVLFQYSYITGDKVCVIAVLLRDMAVFPETFGKVHVQVWRLVAVGSSETKLPGMAGGFCYVHTWV